MTRAGRRDEVPPEEASPDDTQTDGASSVDAAEVARLGAGDPLAAADRHAELSATLDRANRQYYIYDAPELADADYDRLLRELITLEAAFPGLVTPESPSQRVGSGPVASTFDEVRHGRQMLSLANAFSHDELRAFDARVRRGLGLAAAPEVVPELRYVAELKIDGLAVSLRYVALIRPRNFRRSPA